MDSLQAGVDRRRFSTLFGSMLPTTSRPDIRTSWRSAVSTTPSCASRVLCAQVMTVALFSPELKGKLYSKHVGQPKGWPVAEMEAAKGEPAPTMT